MWTCTEVEGGVEILRYNGNATDIIVPSVIAGEQAIPGFVIKGVAGSVAEKYALENGIQFIAIG